MRSARDGSFSSFPDAIAIFELGSSSIDLMSPITFFGPIGEEDAASLEQQVQARKTSIQSCEPGGTGRPTNAAFAQSCSSVTTVWLCTANFGLAVRLLLQCSSK